MSKYVHLFFKGEGDTGGEVEVWERLWLVTSLLVIVVLLSVGCTVQTDYPADEEEEIPPEEINTLPIIEPVEFWFPDSLRWLTDSEKDKVIEIALDTPEALEWQQKESRYKIEISWLAIYPDSSGEGYNSYRNYEYETVATGIPIYPPGRIVAIGDVQKDAEIYPQVHISFGDPLRWIVSVAVDLDEEKAVYIDEYPARYGPAPPKEED